MKKKYLKCTSCMYILMRVLETNRFDKNEIQNILEISDLDYFRYKAEVLNMLYDFGYYDVLDKIKDI